MTDTEKKELTIFRKMSAFLLFSNLGIEEALRVYPGEKEYIEENKKKSYLQVKSELVRELHELKTQFN